jgi:hypothetical protein
MDVNKVKILQSPGDKTILIPIGNQNDLLNREDAIVQEENRIIEEIIELPPIPQQKWMFIAILRDGRRFDIIYNNEIVASQILENYPVVISSSLSIGNTGINGSVIHVIINDKRLTPTQIERERVTRVNTNNMILEADSITMNLPGLNLFGQCPPGLPCDPITKPPTNNLLQWKTPYA